MVNPVNFFSHYNFILPVQIAPSRNMYSVSELVDSDMAWNFINRTLTKKLQLSLKPPQHALKVQALDRGPFGGG